MNLPLLLVNDAGLQLAQPGQAPVESPGFVTVDDREAWFGNDAMARFKLMPTRTDYHYWEKLGLDPLTTPSRLARTPADLAWLQLQDLFRQHAPGDRLALVCSGDLPREQLSLLLGILQKLGHSVPAVIDQALAACSRPEPGRQLMVLDLHLHRAVLTRLDQSDELLAEASVASPEISLMRLREAWATAITRLFVQATRFDPQHDAVVEQQLHDRLPDWLATLHEQDQLDISLEREQQVFRTRLTRQLLDSAVAPLLRRLLHFVEQQRTAGQPLSLAVSHRVAAWPGLVQALGSLAETRVMTLAPDAVLNGARSILDGLPAGEGTVLVRRKPWFDSSLVRQHSAGLADFRRAVPSHVLCQGRAWPLDQGEVLLGSAASAHVVLGDDGERVLGEHCRLQLREGRVLLHNSDGARTLLNRQPVESAQEVHVGDRITLGSSSIEVQLIEVHSGLADVAEHGERGRGAA